MLKFSGAFFIILTLTTWSAHSATPPSLRPFYAVTVKDYLDACKVHQDTCSLEVGTALIDKINVPGVAEVCLDSGYDVHAILDWLSLHSETHQLPTEDGIYLAAKSLYRCR